MNYWAAKKQNAERAKRRTEKFEANFTPSMNYALVGTTVYGGKDQNVTGNPFADICEEFEVVQMSTTEAIYKLGHNNCIALNFASYKNPGGAYLNGSCAQEESLCHESWLYNILARFQSYYDWNKKNLNRGLYKDRALYTPDVTFSDGERNAIADVLTCAAPNRSIIAKGYTNFTEEENYKVLHDRMLFMSKICSLREKDVLILGAWGCGVFKQDPAVVARLIHNTTWRGVKKIVLAVIDKPTYEIFKREFECES